VVPGCAGVQRAALNLMLHLSSTCVHALIVQPGSSACIAAHAELHAALLSLLADGPLLSASDGLTWLCLQEALMYVNWPASVLSHPGFEQMLDPGTGLPLFRGPRLRMGLAEGQPNSVIPDHNGRANYWGSCVNRYVREEQEYIHTPLCSCIVCALPDDVVPTTGAPVSTGAGAGGWRGGGAAHTHTFVRSHCLCIA
jgi:hypothetical protein